MTKQTGNKTFIDQLGDEILVPYPPQRIISLVPSQTELLFDLGIHKRIVGITKFCIHPASAVSSIPRIGGTKNFRPEKIEVLNPDLIIGNKEENEKDSIKELKQKYPVWMSDVKSLEDAFDMIGKIGAMVMKKEMAEQIIRNIQTEFSKLKPVATYKALYLIWKKPYMAVGKDTFINQMMKICAFENILQTRERYPSLNISTLKQYQPDIVLLSSEPYPFGNKHIPEFETIFPNAKILIVNGEYFSWYGSRIQYLPAYYEKLAPELV